MGVESECSEEWEELLSEDLRVTRWGATVICRNQCSNVTVLTQCASNPGITRGNHPKWEPVLARARQMFSRAHSEPTAKNVPGRVYTGEKWGISARDWNQEVRPSVQFHTIASFFQPKFSRSLLLLQNVSHLYSWVASCHIRTEVMSSSDIIMFEFQITTQN